jgi:hypothetical protein
MFGYGRSTPFHDLSKKDFFIVCDALRIKVDEMFTTHRSALRAVRAYLNSGHTNDFDIWLFPTLAAAKTVETSPDVLAALEQLKLLQFETLERRFVYLWRREVRLQFPYVNYCFLC